LKIFLQRTNDLTKTKILELIQAWNQVFVGQDDLKAICEAYNQLRRQGAFLLFSFLLSQKPQMELSLFFLFCAF